MERNGGEGTGREGERGGEGKMKMKIIRLTGSSFPGPYVVYNILFHFSNN